MFVEGADAQWNRIEGNVIGTNGTRSLALGNHDAGVWISSAGGNVVGGSAPRAGNVLAFNAGGVRVASGAHNAIVGNAILGSTGVPIDLQGGANSGMGAPTLTSAAPAGSATTIVGSFAGDPSAGIALEFFASGTCDPSGFGPGEHAIGSIVVTTDVAGNAAYTATLPVRITGLPFITATATNENADTSGFSRCVALQTTMVPGDVDGDGSVTCADFARVRRALGTQTGQPGFDARADLNGDGVINVKDLAFVARLLPAGTRCQ